MKTLQGLIEEAKLLANRKPKRYQGKGKSKRVRRKDPKIKTVKPGRPKDPNVQKAAKLVVNDGWSAAVAARACGAQYPSVRAAAKRLREELGRAK